MSHDSRRSIPQPHATNARAARRHDEEVFDRTRYLKNESDQELPSENTELLKEGAPPGTMGGEALIFGVMVITALPAILTPLLDLVHDWLSRDRDIKIKAKFGDSQVSFGSDVVGRDKIISIHAEAGATVHIGRAETASVKIDDAAKPADEPAIH